MANFRNNLANEKLIFGNGPISEVWEDADRFTLYYYMCKTLKLYEVWPYESYGSYSTIYSHWKIYRNL